MKKTNAYLWIVVFVVLFLTPFLTYPLFRKVVSVTEIQNQIDAPTPELSLENYTNIAGQLETVFKNRIPYRDALIYLNTITSYELFGASTVEEVVAGKEDWLFYRDSLADYKGTNLYTEEELLQIKENLEKSKAYLDERGIIFVVYIAPNKATIYGEAYLPDGISRQNEQSRTEQLVSYLREHTDIEILFPKEELCQAAEAYPQQNLYFKSDTHWNFLGGYYGAQALLEKLNLTLPKIDTLTVEKTSEPYFFWKNGLDLENMMGLTGYFNQEQNYQLSGYSEFTAVTSQDDRRNYEDFANVCRYQSDSENKQKLMLVRDSFGTGMLPYLAVNFAEVYSPYAGAFSIESIDEEQPDIFVFEMVERADLINFVLEP